MEPSGEGGLPEGDIELRSELGQRTSPAKARPQDTIGGRRKIMNKGPRCDWRGEQGLDIM